MNREPNRWTHKISVSQTCAHVKRCQVQKLYGLQTLKASIEDAFTYGLHKYGNQTEVHKTAVNKNSVIEDFTIPAMKCANRTYLPNLLIRSNKQAHF